MKHSTIRRMALALIATLAAGSAMAQDRAQAYISKTSPATPLVVDLSDTDGITASATITEGYVYGGLAAGSPTSGEPYLSSIQFTPKETFLPDGSVQSVMSFGRYVNRLQQGEAYVTAEDGRFAAALIGSLMTVSVTAHTSVTIDTSVYGAVEVPKLEGYEAPTDPSMPSVKSILYSYLGPVDDAVLAATGVGANLFAPDAEGYICPGCLGVPSYWTEYLELDPSMPAETGESGALLRELNTTQQYTLTNEGDVTQVFHVLRFAAVAAMNVAPASSVPESGTAALLSLGLAALAWRHRRINRG